MAPMINGRSVVRGTVTWDCGDDAPTFDAYYDPSERWNGFIAAPHLTLASALRLMAFNDAERAIRADSCAAFTYDADALCFTETDDTFGGEDPFVQHICADYLDSDTMPNDPSASEPLFAIGAYGWTWVEADES
jgi:hypothetical protein